METIPQLRMDKLRYLEEFEAIVESERDTRRKEFYRFVSAQSLFAVSTSGDDVSLDMRGVSELARRMFDRELLLKKILDGEVQEGDF